jgi:hypothetical protein
MNLPVSEVQPLAILAGQKNGLLPQRILVAVELPGEIRGRLLTVVAEHLTSMADAIRADLGVILTAVSNGDIYRSLASQETLFRQRYSPTPLVGRPTKFWAGETWWLKPKMATAATPGSSNHGWARAIDLAEFVDGNRVGISDRSVQWLIDHAAEFGFSAELQQEKWHWRYFWGDQVPTPQPIQGDDVVRFIRIDGTDPVWQSNNAQFLTWIDSPEKLADRYAVLRANGVEPGEVHVVANGDDWRKWGDPIGAMPPDWHQ